MLRYSVTPSGIDAVCTLNHFQIDSVCESADEGKPGASGVSRMMMVIYLYAVFCCSLVGLVLGLLGFSQCNRLETKDLSLKKKQMIYYF